MPKIVADAPGVTLDDDEVVGECADEGESSKLPEADDVLLGVAVMGGVPDTMTEAVSDPVTAHDALEDPSALALAVGQLDELEPSEFEDDWDGDCDVAAERDSDIVRDAEAEPSADAETVAIEFVAELEKEASADFETDGVFDSDGEGVSLREPEAQAVGVRDPGAVFEASMEGETDVVVLAEGEPFADADGDDCAVSVQLDVREGRVEAVPCRLRDSEVEPVADGDRAAETVSRTEADDDFVPTAVALSVACAENVVETLGEPVIRADIESTADVDGDAVCEALRWLVPETVGETEETADGEDCIVVVELMDGEGENEVSAEFVTDSRAEMVNVAVADAVEHTVANALPVKEAETVAVARLVADTLPQGDAETLTRLVAETVDVLLEVTDTETDGESVNCAVAVALTLGDGESVD